MDDAKHDLDNAIGHLVRVLRLAPNSQGPKLPNETGGMTIDTAR
jgi:hypothetical protein